MISKHQQSCIPFSRFFTLREVNVMRMRWTWATSSSWPGLPRAFRADICNTPLWVPSESINFYHNI